MKNFILILILVSLSVADSSDLAKKKVMIGDLKNKEFELKREHNQTIPKLPKIEAFCLKEKTTVEECKVKVDSALNRIQNKAQVLSNTKNRGELLEKRNDKLQKQGRS